MYNIFQNLRENGVDLSNESLIRYEVANTLNGTYCYTNTYGKYPYYAVDGDDGTAWTNKDPGNPSEQYFIIDFMERSVALVSYRIDTLCNPPAEMFLYASNDKNDWVTLSHVTKPLKSYSSNTYNVRNHNNFRYFSINQTRSTDDFRLIIRNIEFYGTFGTIEATHNHHSISLVSIMSIYFCIMI